MSDLQSAALRLVIEYDDLLRKFEGPKEFLFAGDVAEIDDAYDRMVAACREAASQPLTFQSRVSIAHRALFHDDPTDIAERRARFFEEATETAQALGMTGDEARQLIDYTFGRPAGEPVKEIGAAALTLASLCVVAGYDMMACAEADLEKLQRPETIARIRAKRATRHGRGPLPGLDPAIETLRQLPSQPAQQSSAYADRNAVTNKTDHRSHLQNAAATSCIASAKESSLDASVALPTGGGE